MHASWFAEFCIHIQRGFSPKRNSLGRSCVVCPAFAIRNRPVRFSSDSTGCIFDIKDVLTNWDLIEDGAKMGLSWLLNDFICNDLYAPFVVKLDNDYYSRLMEKYNIVLNQAEKAGADDGSLAIIKKYRNKILEALRSYYKADIAKSNTIIRNLVSEVRSDPFAVAKLGESWAFPGNRSQEIQFFRSRTGSPSSAYAAKEMLHLPKSLRSKTGSYRFSIPGSPAYYLANSSYGCWIETGFPPEIDFNVSPVVLDGTQKILNLAINVRDFGGLDGFDEGRVHCWLKLFMLMIATSYRIDESDRTFKSEYIVPQAIMMACKKLGLDGVAYYSRRVEDDVFARCAVNLALFVNYNQHKDYSPLIKHMKIDDSFNYALYKQLSPSLRCRDYELRSVDHAYITNIGSYDRQHPYRETEFFEFDRYLFATWQGKTNGRGKDVLPWGVSVD